MRIMGHYCRICGRTRANEKFTGKGHASHICKDCAPTLRQKHIKKHKKDNRNPLVAAKKKHEEIISKSR